MSVPEGFKGIPAARNLGDLDFLPLKEGEAGGPSVIAELNGGTGKMEGGVFSLQEKDTQPVATQGAGDDTLHLSPTHDEEGFMNEDQSRFPEDD